MIMVLAIAQFLALHLFLLVWHYSNLRNRKLQVSSSNHKSCTWQGKIPDPFDKEIVRRPQVVVYEPQAKEAELIDPSCFPYRQPSRIAPEVPARGGS